MDLRENHVVELRQPCPVELLELRRACGVLMLLEWLRQCEVADAETAQARLEMTRAADHRELARKLLRLVQEPWAP